MKQKIAGGEKKILEKLRGKGGIFIGRSQISENYGSWQHVLTGRKCLCTERCDIVAQCVLRAFVKGVVSTDTFLINLISAIPRKTLHLIAFFPIFADVSLRKKIGLRIVFPCS